jgi:PIN domain nuclease of toxin-antitoxin system
VSVISCWEVAKWVELDRLVLHGPVGESIEQALAYPGVRLLYLSQQRGCQEPTRPDDSVPDTQRPRRKCCPPTWRRVRPCRP